MRRAFSKPTRTGADYETLMRDYRAEGYEGLQLKMGQYGQWLDDPDGYLDRWGDDPGRASALIYFDTLDQSGSERLCATVRLAERIGSERVVFCHNHPRSGVTKRQLVEFAKQLSEFGADAQSRGVALSLHHHYDQPVMHREDFETFFRAVTGATVGLTVDTAHLAKSGIDNIPGFVRDFAELIDNVHLKDYAEGEWRLLGKGTLDLEGILDSLEGSRYEGWLCVDDESSADLATGFRASREWLDRHP
jgi:inosose dehydratase